MVLFSARRYNVFQMFNKLLLIFLLLRHGETQVSECGQCICENINDGLGKAADCRFGKTLNPLSLVPSDLGIIHRIDLTGQHLKQLIQNVFYDSNLINLEYITLENCSLNKIDKTAFKSLSVLIHLNLALNQLQELETDIFEDNKSLKYINLTRNNLQVINQRTIASLNKLDTIDLSSNRIKTIDLQFTSNYLKEVKLNSNELSRLDVEVFGHRRNLKEVTLYLNPWICDCFLRDLHEFVLTLPGFLLNITDCEAPEKHKSKRWNEIYLCNMTCDPEVNIYPEFEIVSVELYGNLTLACLVSMEFSVDNMDIKWKFPNDIKVEENYMVEVNGNNTLWWSNVTIVNITEGFQGVYRLLIYLLLTVFILSFSFDKYL